MTATTTLGDDAFQDIADYLGLTVETVSRTFTLSKERGAIALPAIRRVEIRKPKALERPAALPALRRPICA